LEKCGTLEKIAAHQQRCGTLGKMRHTRKNAAHWEKCGILKRCGTL